MEEILERVHGSFFSSLDEIKSKGGLSKEDPNLTRLCTPGTINPDTRAIIHALRQQTLKGASVVFTGVIPTNIPLEKSAPYRAAIRLGAKVTCNIVRRKSNDRSGSAASADYTTHVIAARLGTEKAYKAGKISHIKLVNPAWLWCCAQRWERVEEMLFKVQERGASNGMGTPETSYRGTPTMDTAENAKESSKENNNISPLAKETRKANARRAAPVEVFDSISPTTFSKDEVEEMDKEVEEYMFSDKEEEGADCVGSVSGSSRRSSSEPGSRSSSRSSTASNSHSTKRKQDNGPGNVSTKRSRGANQNVSLSSAVASNVERHSNSSHADSSHSDSSDGDSDGSDSEDDTQIGALLERQISSAPYP